MRDISGEYNIYEFMKLNVLSPNSYINYAAMFFGVDAKACSMEQKMIFQDFRDEGYISINTILHKDKPNHILCCQNQHNSTPFDHSIQIIAHDKNYRKNQYLSRPRCAGGKDIHKYTFKYITEAIEHYNKFNQPIISVSTFMDSHDDNFKSTPRLDKDLTDFLMNLKVKVILNKTLIVLSSDHGMHYGFFRQKKFGVIDNALPLLSFV